MELLHAGSAHDRVRAALDSIAAGRPVVVVDDADRENEGDLIFSASHATPALMAFTVRHTSGFVCVALTDEDCDRLDLPPMWHSNADRFGTDYRVTVDLNRTGTGISATDRAATAAALASPESTSEDFTRPGHVVPLRARPGGVLERPGHTEAAVDLTRLAGLPGAGVLCEIVSADRPTEMARGAELERFAREHGLVLVSVADLADYRRATEPQARRTTETRLPTEHGQFRAIGYASAHDGAEHLALLAGPVDRTVPVHVRTECLAADIAGSAACECRRELDDALARFAADQSGVVLYLRPAGAPRACGLFDRSRPDNRRTAEWILADLGISITGPASGPKPAAPDTAPHAAAAPAPAA